MNVVKDYNDIAPGWLQQTRLYMQGRPLVSLWRKKRNNIRYECPDYVTQIDRELTSDYVAVDCGGWYFSNQDRKCTAIELFDLSKRLWTDVHLEYDYLTWRPTYLPNVPVLAYHSTYFKYCTLEHFFTFVRIWGEQHPKLIIGIDPTKVKFNYLKYDFVDCVQKEFSQQFKLEVLARSNFNLLFTIKKI